jgi:hypothetical protein
MFTLWIKNTDGKPDAVLTFALMSVVTVLFKLLLAGLVVSYKTYFTWTITVPDAATIGAVFLPTLGAYVSNKYVTYNYHPDNVARRLAGEGDNKIDGK